MEPHETRIRARHTPIMMIITPAPRSRSVHHEISSSVVVVVVVGSQMRRIVQDRFTHVCVRRAHLSRARRPRDLAQIRFQGVVGRRSVVRSSSSSSSRRSGAGCVVRALDARQSAAFVGGARRRSVVGVVCVLNRGRGRTRDVVGRTVEASASSSFVVRRRRRSWWSSSLIH